MINITIDQKDLEVTLRGLQEGLGDLRPVWQGAAHQIFLDMMQAHFVSEGQHSGEGWVPLSPGYAAWKERNYPGQPLMRLTDRLFGSLTTKDDPEHVFRSGPSFAEYGTQVRYAPAHHYGYPPRNLPVRRVIPRLTTEEGERLVDAIVAYLFQKMRMSIAATRSR